MKSFFLLPVLVMASSFIRGDKKDFIADEKNKVVTRFSENGKIIDKGKPYVCFKTRTDSIVPDFINDSTFLLDKITDSVEICFRYHSFIGSTGMIPSYKLQNFDKIQVDVMYCGNSCYSDYAVVFSPDGPFIIFYAPYIRKK
jgi:hypothetical protein